MALSSTTSRNKYTASGSNSTYSYTFKIFSETDLLVTVRDTNNVETVLSYPADYSVAGAGVSTGGSITLAAGNLTVGYILIIRRVRPLTQQQDFRNQDEFFPENHEDSFDKSVMIDQQLQDEASRSIQLPETISSSDFNPILPATIAAVPGAAVVVNDTGNGFKMGSVSAVTDTSRVSKSGDTMTGLLTAAAGVSTTTLSASGATTLAAVTASGLATFNGGIATASFLAPTVQRFISGSGTYTLPSSPRKPLYLKVSMSGGGGGGGGASGNGGSGSNCTFGSSLLTAGGGNGGVQSGNGGSPAAGGTNTIAAGPTILKNIQGGSGGGNTNGPNTIEPAGGVGGVNAFGGGGGGGNGNSVAASAAGGNASANTGAGGGGAGGASTGGVAAAGGSAGGYLEVIISSPATTYAYSVGATGTGGTGTPGGGTGAAGQIIIEEFYQ